jgi:hypothetical protein
MSSHGKEEDKTQKEGTRFEMIFAFDLGNGWDVHSTGYITNVSRFPSLFHARMDCSQKSCFDIRPPAQLGGHFPIFVHHQKLSG